MLCKKSHTTLPLEDYNEMLLDFCRDIYRPREIKNINNTLVGLLRYFLKNVIKNISLYDTKKAHVTF